MNRSTKTRYAIFQILIEVFKKNRSFETVFNQKIIEFNFNKNEISFINNVCLNSMRKSIYCKIILQCMLLLIEFKQTLLIKDISLLLKLNSAIF